MKFLIHGKKGMEVWQIVLIVLAVALLLVWIGAALGWDDLLGELLGGFLDSMFR